MTSIRRATYLCLLAIWLAYGVLIPTWTGRFYNPETPENPARWFDGGTFALKNGDSSGVRVKAPLWNPPVAFGDGIEAQVRWPWQPVARPANIELSLVAMSFRWSFGVIALGIVFFVWNWIRPARQPDLILTIAWTAALWQVIAWLGIAGTIAATSGFAPDEILIGILAGGVVAGVVHGVLLWRKRCARESIAPTVPGH